MISLHSLPGRLVLLAAACAIVTSQAAAQKPPPPWEITEVKVSGTAPSRDGSDVTVFDGGNKERKVFLHVTVQFKKAPTAATVQALQVIDKKKKPLAKLFNVVVDKADKKTVTVIFEAAKPWESLDDLQLKGGSHSAPVEKKDAPGKK